MAFSPARSRGWLIVAALIAAICLAYSDSLEGPFIFDDLNAITNNPHIRSILPLTTSMTAQPLSVLVGRPVVCLSLAINYAIGGLNPFGYHLFNLLTHIACALLIYGLFRRNLLLPRWQGQFTPPAAQSIAGASALIWALHPLATEAVTYVTQRTETMESMFLLLTLYCVARASQSARPWAWNCLAIAACAAGMGSKEQMVVCPLLVLLYDYMFLPKRAANQRAFHFLYAGLFLTWLLIYLELKGADLDAKSGYGFKYVYWFDYLKTQSLVIAHYLRLCFWPSGLVIDYTDWPVTKGFLPALIPGLFLSILAIASAFACLFRWWPGFLGAWFFMILAPTSSVVPNFTEIAAERRMYLPLVSVVILTIAIARAALKAAIARTALVIVVFLLGTLTYLRNQDYRSALAIWTDAVAKRPANWHAHYFLGRSYADLSDWDNAQAQADIAHQLLPGATAPVALQQYILQHAPPR